MNYKFYLKNKNEHNMNFLKEEQIGKHILSDIKSIIKLQQEKQGGNICRIDAHQSRKECPEQMLICGT